MLETSQLIQLLIAMAFTIMMFSFALWRTTNNPFYRFAEHTFVAVSMGNMIVMAYRYLQGNVFEPVIQGDLILLIPIVAGLMLYFRFSKKYFYVCRWPLSFMVGIGLGLTLRGWTHGWLYQGMIKATILPLFVAGDPMGSFNNIVVVVITLTVLSYFLFSIEHKGTLGYSARIGRYIMMVMFGVMFANIAFGRLASLSGRLRFLLEGILTLLGQ